MEIAPRERLFENPVHPYTRALLAAVPRTDPSARLDLGALMEGKVSSPPEWPEPFTVRPGAKPELVEIAPGARGAHQRGASGMTALARTVAPAAAALLALLLAVLPGVEAAGARYIETPSLAEEVGAGRLPPVERRLPARPKVVALTGDGLAPGRHGGELRLLMGRAKDVRLLVVYGYARLSATSSTTVSLPISWPGWRSRTGGSSPCGFGPGTAGRTAVRSPARTSATTGRTSPPTSPSLRSARPGRISSKASRRASRCSMSTPCATRGRGPTRSSWRRWPARGPSRCTRPPTTSRRFTPATPTRKR